MKYFGRAEEIAQKIVDAFKEPGKLPKALAPIFIKRNDDIPCRKWSWHNQLLVALSGTSDARGMKQWNQIGRKIKRGCKAIWIMGPCVKNVTEENESGEESKKSILYGFRGIPVFGVEDTEGEPLPGKEQHDAWVRNLPLVEVAENWGIHVDTFSHEGKDPLGYYRFGGSQKAIMLGTENLSTWAHELVHAADAQLTKFAGSSAIHEIVAELGSAILLECLGHSHDADLGGAYAYITRYSEQTGKPTVRCCADVLDRACNCVTMILETAEKLEEESVTVPV